MSKRQVKSHASSSRAAASAFGGGFGSFSSFGSSASQLSYVSEPPDLSSISDANTVVLFKNLSKKDSTTKAKALEDLQTHITSPSGVEDAVLEAWVQLYPRTSIDSARRVRQLAHTVQGQIASACGKRIAKFMPKIVGAWLAGLYDNDKSVALAAQASFKAVFSTPEKMHNVRKAFQQNILEYCRTVIDKESVNSLSDERNTSKDDAEAKYNRVIASSLAVIASLLSELSPDELAKERESYEEAIQDGRLWDFSSYNDPAVRRAVHRLLRTCISKQQDVLSANLSTISQSYLGKALNSDQTGSSWGLTETLVVLTARFPTTWTEEYTSKKSPVTRRLRQFLKRGSQGGPKEYWENVAKILDSLPQEVLPSNSSEAVELLGALHAGIVNKDEPRANLAAAYSCYFKIVALTSARLSTEEQEKLLAEMVLPLVLHYIKPNQDTAVWAVPAPQAPGLVGRALAIPNMPTVILEPWKQTTKDLIEDMKTSLPAQSKDFEKSQNEVMGAGQRWALVTGKIVDYDLPPSVRSAIKESTRQLLKEALDLLSSRNGKPYCAAGIVAAMLQTFKLFLADDVEFEEALLAFVKNGIPSLFLSPSSSHLATILYSFSERPEFGQAWNATLEACINASQPDVKLEAITSLLSSQAAEQSKLAVANPDLQAFILENFRSAGEGSTNWDFVNRILQHSTSALSDETVDTVLADLTQSLSVSNKATYALQGLSNIVQYNPDLVKRYVPTAQGSELLQKLVSITENPNDEVAEQATILEKRLKETLSDEQSRGALKNSIADVIARGLVDASANSVSPTTLVDLGKDLIQGSDLKNLDLVEGLLPSFSAWKTALEPFLSIPPHPTFAITNQLGGVVYLVGKQHVSPPKVARDAAGFSPALRMAAYTVKLFNETSVFDVLPAERRAQIYEQLLLTILLANDNLSRATSNNIWSRYNPQTENDALEIISDAQRLMTSWLEKSSRDEASAYYFVHSTLEFFRKSSEEVSPRGFYNAVAYSDVTAEIISLQGWQGKKAPQMELSLNAVKKTDETLLVAAFLVGNSAPLAASGSASRLCNELVAQLTGHDIAENSQEGLRLLAILNLIIHNQEGVVEMIAKQRLIFFVKHVIEWLDPESTLGLPLRAEAYRALVVLLPQMSDIYGDHWEQVLQSLTSFWGSAESFKETQLGFEEALPAIHASLKLYATLRSLKSDEDPNDDLVDAWKAQEHAAANGLVNLLKQSEGLDDYHHQPFKIVNELLSRQINQLPLTQVDNPTEASFHPKLYPLLLTESGSVQQAAFDLLHKAIPAAQEQISIDAALDKKAARLPDELLSLILEAPPKEAIASWDFQRAMPLSLRGYLFSWLLIFDHFTNSSYKVKTDYIEHLQSEGHVPALLDFLVEFLGHSKGKPADISKVDVTTYDAATAAADTPLADARHLASHLYFLVFNHLPSLAKSWWIDCKSRQTVLAVESWTERFISPHIIGGALAAVSAWATTDNASDGDAALTVKVNGRAKEVVAGYEVDEQFMTMAMRLPATYPLASVTVEGINRVAVSEHKWQSWLRAAQGVVVFSNGNLVDGLVAWRRNVVGALRGQSECAICYSIISADKQLPSKRCLTCKNLFHSSCLFKWFKSSNGSSCPLCRNPFNYG
ncbi:RING zinc finger protein-like protein [Phyllosticta capitalensis]|uniref:RING zinc finger protein-like protein n=1 Tax=Phyllosticta capitalensis TaxID=121624 RepID=UPI00312E2D33